MPFEIKKGKKKVSLALKDRVDISEAAEIWEAMKGKTTSDFEIDMANVSSMDCSILQLLLATQSSLKKNGANLRLTARSDEAAKVIKLGGAAEVL